MSMKNLRLHKGVAGVVAVTVPILFMVCLVVLLVMVVINKIF